MACPIAITKFVGTITLGLLTGVSYATTGVTIPSLKLLPTSANAARCLSEVKRLNRRQVLGLTGLSNACLLFAFFMSPKHRKHPYMIWMCVTSALGAFGVDYWFNRQLGLSGWIKSLVQESKLGFATPKKEEDLVVVETEESINGERVQRGLDREFNMQIVRLYFSTAALGMGVVGLWGDRS